MMISTKGRYALSTLIDIAEQEKKRRTGFHQGSGGATGNFREIFRADYSPDGEGRLFKEC